MDGSQTATHFAAPARVPVTARPPVSARPDVISIEAIDKRFTVRGREVAVLRDFSCTIARDSFVSVIGPSGCGKSTLLRLLAGLDRPTAGQILFDGAPIDGPPPGMIAVFQQYAKSIFPWRSVANNVAFGIDPAARLSRAERADLVAEHLELVGLSDHADHWPAQISGGMQQRLAIARALIRKPEVLLMDEPFSAVDAMTRALLQDLLHQIWRSRPITIIFVTHDVDEAVLLSQRVLSLGRNGSGLREDVTIDLPQPRDQIATRADPGFIALRQRLFASIFHQEQAS
jgi:NitT/TauT family transport system ATP-binding protein